MSPDGSHGPHVFVDDLDVPVLSEADAHHLQRVLRLRPGAALTISDGRGRWRTGTLGSSERSAEGAGDGGAAGSLIELGPVLQVERPAPAIAIAFALVKGERPELVVQKLTELGVDRIIPFVAERSVVRWDTDRAARNAERLTRVAREASMQSRRCWLPVVERVATFDEVVAEPGAAAADPGGGPLSLAHPTILVGPEGGWSASERERLPRVVALADHVLRAETASITAAGLLGALRSERVRPTGPR